MTGGLAATSQIEEVRMSLDKLEALRAVARAAGGTAPRIFTAFGNRILKFDVTQPMQALPRTVVQDSLVPCKDLQDQAWGAALLLGALVLVVNLASRFALRRQLAFAGKGL